MLVLPFLPVCSVGGSCIYCFDFCGFGISDVGSILMFAENEAYNERTDVLRDRVYAESHCSGSYRRRTACDGIVLR